MRGRPTAQSHFKCPGGPFFKETNVRLNPERRKKDVEGSPHERAKNGLFIVQDNLLKEHGRSENRAEGDW